LVEQLLQEIDDERLRVDFVWTRIWSIDNLGSAHKYMPKAPDPRARVWWDQFNQLSDGLSPFMSGIKPVWDVYLLYEAGREWDPESKTPGAPDYFEHQLGELNPAYLLNKKTLKQAILARLPDCSGN
jgi:hypothetical protein